jgi:hypothetical protein
LQCSQTGNHPQEDLAKYGYRLDMKEDLAKYGYRLDMKDFFF